VPTAIYIEYPRITAVEITGSARKPRIKRVAVGSVAEARNEDGTPVADRQAHLNAQVEAFIKENKLSGKLYLVIGPEGMRYRDIHLAFSDRKQIERVLQFQVEGVIPNVPIEDMTLGYNVLRADPHGSHLLVHAGDKDYARSRIDALEEAGQFVEGADSHLSGTLNLGMLHPDLAEGIEPTLWLDFAGSIATVAEVHEGKVHTARVFLSPYLAEVEPADKAKAAARTAQAVAEQSLSEIQGRSESDRLTQSDIILLDESNPEESQIIPAADSVNLGEHVVAERIRHMSRDEILRFMNRVGVEARRTLLMSNLEQEPTRLVISGLGDAGQQMAALLSNELGIENATVIDLLESMNPRGKDGKPAVDLPDLGELSYVAGVALKGVGADYTRINFRYGDLAPGTLFDYAKTPLAFTATLVLLFAGILFLMSFTHARQYERALFDLRTPEGGRGPEWYFKEAFRKSSAKDLPKYQPYPDDPAMEIATAHRLMREHQRVLEVGASDDYLRPYPADQILAELLKAIESAGPSYDFMLQRVVIGRGSMVVDFFVSVSETQEERDRMARQNLIPAELKDRPESDRMIQRLRELVSTRSEWFSELPAVNPTGQVVEGAGGRQARQYNARFVLKTPEQPRPAAKGAKK
jgi:hypothetical protein